MAEVAGNPSLLGMRYPLTVCTTSPECTQADHCYLAALIGAFPSLGKPFPWWREGMSANQRSGFLGFTFSGAITIFYENEGPCFIGVGLFRQICETETTSRCSKVQKSKVPSSPWPILPAQRGFGGIRCHWEEPGRLNPWMMAATQHLLRVAGGRGNRGSGDQTRR